MLDNKTIYIINISGNTIVIINKYDAINDIFDIMKTSIGKIGFAPIADFSL